MASDLRAPSPQVFLGIDYGMKRIGLAVGTTLSQPHALDTITLSKRSEQLLAILNAVREWQVTDIVLGKPVLSHDQLLHNAINKLAHQLAGHCKLPVHFVDESYSSAQASARLKGKGIHGRAQKSKLDQEAACVILEHWCQSHSL
ncbi:MAG: hypothetical protein RLZZ502_65 [Pseudomonadota bacterium]|jgi:putative Holliday junction resolvase